MEKFLTISNASNLLHFPVRSILYVEAAGNYSDIHLSSNDFHTVTFQLGEIEDLIKHQNLNTDGNLVRVGRSIIVNTDNILSINTSRNEILFSTYNGKSVLSSASHESVSKLKKHLESHGS